MSMSTSAAGFHQQSPTHSCCTAAACCPCCPYCRLAPGEYEYECSLDDLVEELLGIKDSLLGMGERVHRQRQEPTIAGRGSGGGARGEAAAAAAMAESGDEYDE